MVELVQVLVVDLPQMQTQLLVVKLMQALVQSLVVELVQVLVLPGFPRRTYHRQTCHRRTCHRRTSHHRPLYKGVDLEARCVYVNRSKPPSRVQDLGLLFSVCPGAARTERGVRE
jgi:hypothetical protein